MKQPKPIGRNYSYIVNCIDTGKYQIPKFQRDFVWSVKETANFIDSLIKGFPVGSFILWKTSDRLRSIKKIGDNFLKEPEEKEIYYILDGQQRITSLYLAIKGIETNAQNYKNIYINLDANSNEDDICSTENSNANSISFYDLMNKKIHEISKIYDNAIVEKIENIRENIKQYEFSTIEIEDKPLLEIAEIFTRINTSGKELTLFEIMCAKIYSEEENNCFDLEEKFDEFVEKLKYCGYESISDSKTTLLQLISLCIKKSAKKEKILSIEKNEFIDSWYDITECANLAIDFIKSRLLVPVSKLLPYYALIIPIGYFYYINQKKTPNNNQAKLLEKYFFRSAISHRFSSAVETKLNSDIDIIEKIKNEESIDFAKMLEIQNTSKEYFIEQLKSDFSASNAFHKAVLCILASKEPKNLLNGAKVNIDNSNLSKSNSKNYHHFFPKAYLKKQNIPNENALSNITLISAEQNQNTIKAKAPSIYIKEFEEQNPHLEEDLKTHLIDLNEFIRDNNYDDFLNLRASKIADEIIIRI